MSARRCLLLLLLISAVVLQGRATHLRAGQIVVKRVNCSPNQFDITITVYTDTESGVKFGGNQEDGLDVLDFGDGTRFIIPETDSEDLPGTDKIGIASYTIRHSYGPGRYLISYREPNRNDHVLNMVNSVLTTFYIETLLNNEPIAECNNTPLLRVPPIDRGCIGVAFQHNPGAYDPDGDSLSYELVIPYKDRNQSVDGYTFPDNQEFYPGNYQTGNEEGNGPPSFEINKRTGLITWNAPGMEGEFNIAFIVVEWRKIFGVWTKLGFVRRDMQIIIDDCVNERPDLILPNDTCVVAGTTLEAIIRGFDVRDINGNINDFTIQAFSEILDAGFTSPAVTSPNPAEFPATDSQNPAEVSFTWNTVCDHVKEQPYQVVFKITDKGQPRLATFKTWFIKVVGPSPEWNQTTVDFAKRHVLLEWNDYECDNASGMEVWRKVDSFNYTPSNCETGMPSSLGYELIGEVDITTGTTSFNDTNNGKGLDIGARYCYRLVAKFPTPAGGESYMSDEICIDPIYSDAPIITHVSVQKTDETDGEIRVSWRSPMQIDETQFPPPYEYKVWRSTGFTGGLPWVEVHPNTISDTTEVDIGINTLNSTYSYHVVVYSDMGSGYEPIDTSSVASQVRLEIQSKTSQLDLSWSAFTPWSNVSFTYPDHDVLRGPGGSTETSGLVFFEAVNVTTDGFRYSDETVNNTDEYCYRIMTRGTYGNPVIDEPQENYSQIVCARGSDTKAPVCKAEPVIVNKLSCDEYLADEETCGQTFFYNDVRWNRVTTSQCDGDVLGYRVYVANSENGVYQKVIFEDGRDFTLDTVFVDDNEGLGLTSFARCYKVSVIDRSGNESDLSDPVCNDNCPYYAMPNMFSPNGDGCNERFSAFGDPVTTGEESPSENPNCMEPDPDVVAYCARFVETVSFQVFNRWGKRVYQFESVRGDTGKKSIYVRWDGRDEFGNPLPTGVYFYAADVTFTTSNPANRNKTIKGWVHLVK